MRVKVRRVGDDRGGRWRLLLLPAALALAGLIILSLVLSFFLILLPFLIIALAIVVVLRWLLSSGGLRRKGPTP